MVARPLVLALLLLAPTSALAGSTRCQSAAEKQAVCVPGSTGERTTCAESTPRQHLWSAFTPNSAMVPLFSALLSASWTTPETEPSKPVAPRSDSEATPPRRMPLYLTRNVQLL